MTTPEMTEREFTAGLGLDLIKGKVWELVAGVNTNCPSAAATAADAAFDAMISAIRPAEPVPIPF